MMMIYLVTNGWYTNIFKIKNTQFAINGKFVNFQLFSVTF